MNFNIETPSKVIFGPSKVKELPDIIKSLSSNIMIVTGKSADRYAGILTELTELDIKYSVYNVNSEPYIETVNEAVKLAREIEASLVLAIGGGSAIDTAKAVSVMLSNPGEVLDYLEGIGKGLPVKEPSVPCIAVPTTSGTGAEVTKNAVLCSREQCKKVSMRSSYMIPDLALIDPELSQTVPQNITAYTGMDAITQIIEPFISCMNNQFTDSICIDAISIAGNSVKKSYSEPDNIEARTNMSYISLIGGMALTNAKLGAVHGFAGAIGGMFNAPHGAVCAALLPHVLEVNLDAVKSRGTSAQLEKYNQLAQVLTGDEKSLASNSVTFIKEINDYLKISGLSKLGISEGDIDSIVSASKNSSSMKGNTLTLTEDELKKIIQMAI